MGRTVRSAVLFAVLLAAVATGVAPAAAAEGDVDDFSFRSLDVDYTLDRAADGTSTLEVVERFVADFPDIDQNHGMRRSIPDTYLGAPLRPELVSITDGDGRPRESETDSSDGTFSMTSRAPGFVHGEQTYVFTYRLVDVTRSFADTGVDEFYWDVNGVDWPQSFGTVTARLHLPADLAARLTGGAACYVGGEGSTATCPIHVDAASDPVAQATAAGLGPHETMTIAVAFSQGTFTPFDSSMLASPWGWAQAGAGVLSIVSVVAAGIVRRRRLADAPGRPTIIAEYTPPAQVDALESAVLLGATPKAIPAELLEQAVVGSIRIIEGGPKAFGGVKLQAELVDPSRADGDGRMLLNGLFPGLAIGDVYEFGRTDTRLSTTAQKILSTAGKDLDRRGLRRPVPVRHRLLPILLALVGAVAVVIAGIAALGAGVAAVWPILLIIGAILAAAVVTILVSRRPLTAEGAEVRDHLRGLREFIEWAEADRIRMLQSPAGAERRPVDTHDPRQMLHLYEELLPYAVVFGQEKQWAKELAVLYGEGNSPSWYVGTHGFQAAAFSAGISSLSTSVSASASTSGGSGGGGSAGGGGGGGGGGGV